MSHYALMFKGNNSGSKADVEDYNKAKNMAKAGIEMVMDGIEGNSMKQIAEGAEIAWEGMKKVCELSDKMKEQFGERRGDSMGYRHDDFGMRDGYNGRDSYNFRDWSNEDDRMMERRMRDSMGRFK